MISKERLSKLPKFVTNYIQALEEENKRLKDQIVMLGNQLNLVHGDIDSPNTKISYKNYRTSFKPINLSQDSVISFKFYDDLFQKIDIHFNVNDKNLLDIYGDQKLAIYSVASNAIQVKLNR